MTIISSSSYPLGYWPAELWLVNLLNCYSLARTSSIMMSHSSAVRCRCGQFWISDVHCKRILQVGVQAWRLLTENFKKFSKSLQADSDCRASISCSTPKDKRLDWLHELGSLGSQETLMLRVILFFLFPCSIKWNQHRFHLRFYKCCQSNETGRKKTWER